LGEANRPGAIRLIVGLGNPGKEYERTRHNAGFWLLEKFAVQSGAPLRKDGKYQALVGRLGSGGPNAGAWLVLPQSFMNASGRAVQMLAGFFKIPAGEILVVHDELDFAPGVAKMKQGGGIAGHNGLRDISHRLGTHDYWRLRLGIGQPADRAQMADYVLGKPSTDDRAAIDEAIARSIEILPQCLSGDMQGAMLKLHSVEKKVEPKKVEPKKLEPKKAEPTVQANPIPTAEPEKAKGILGSLFGKKK
jgi:PTH1 family peptidyl-tRNA hydrolase